MSNSGGTQAAAVAARVAIPSNLKKTIQNIKEITSNHSEDDIYAMLKDCSFDPNETTQRLLHLDSFHKVKSKRDKRKESVKSRSDEESTWRPGHQGRGTRGGRGNYFSQHNSNDSGGQRNASVWKENGVEEIRDKTFRHPTGLKQSDSVQRFRSEKSYSISSNGPVKVPNGSLTGEYDSKLPVVGDTYSSQDDSSAVADSSSHTRSKASAKHAPSDSDPVLVPTHNPSIHTAVGTIKSEVRTQEISAETNSKIATDFGTGNTESISNSSLKPFVPLSVVEPEIFSSVNQREASGFENIAQPKTLQDCKVVVQNHVPNSDSAVKLSSPQGMEEAASKLEKFKFPDGQHVIIPTHIQVPDAVKNLLSFGSLGSFGVREKDVNGERMRNLETVAASDDVNGNLSSCDEDAVSVALQTDHTVHPHSQSHLPDINSPADPKVSSSPPVPKDDHPEEESLPAVGPPFPVVQTTPSYNFGFVPPMLANTIVQHEGFESQAHVSNSQSVSPPAVSTPSFTPPPTQSAGSGQNSVAVSPQPIPVFCHPYPPNYVPYNHYFPFYVPPTMHPYYGHTGFPAPLPTGFLPSPTAAAGMKLSASHYKPGTNSGHQVPAGMPSGHGMYNTSQAGYSSNSGVSSGNSSASEDRVTSKDNINPGQQSEGSTVWFPAAGRDTASFPLNSFLNVPPQGQNIISPQSGPGPFGIYHTLQPMPTLAPGHPLLQQSQPAAGPAETVGPPVNAYQQSQCLQQMNWNT